MIIKESRVPRVPDKKAAKYIPTKKQNKEMLFLIFLELFQSARQKIDIPSMAKEKGIGFPENSLSLPE